MTENNVGKSSMSRRNTDSFQTFSMCSYFFISENINEELRGIG
jgi:hypothetical protein